MSHMSCPNVWKMCRTADWTTWHPRNGTGSDMCIKWLCASFFSVHWKYWNDLNWKFPQPVGCRLCESLARWVGSKPTIPCWSRSNCSRLHWSFDALEINQKNRSTKVANSLECDLNVADLQNCLVGFRAQKNANAGLDYATEEGISLHCESELEGSTQHVA